MKRNLVLLIIVSMFGFSTNNLMADPFGPFGPYSGGGSYEMPGGGPFPQLSDPEPIPVPGLNESKGKTENESFFQQFIPFSRRTKISKLKISDTGGIVCGADGCISSSGEFKLNTLIKETDGNKYQLYKGEGIAIAIEPLEGFEIGEVICEDLRYATPDDADLHTYNFNRNVRFRGENRYVACVLMPAPEDIDYEYLDRDGVEGVRYNNINLKLNDGKASPADTSIDDGTVVYKSNPCAQLLDFEAIFADVLDPYHPRESESSVNFCEGEDSTDCNSGDFYDVYLNNEFNAILRAQGMAPFEWEFESEIWGKEYRSAHDRDEDYFKKDIPRTDDAYEWRSARLEREDFEGAELEVPLESEIRNDLKYVKTVGRFSHYERMPVSALSRSENVREYAKITLKDSCDIGGERRSITKIIPFNVKYRPIEEELMIDLKIKMKINNWWYVNGRGAGALLEFRANGTPIAMSEIFGLGKCSTGEDEAECDGSKTKGTVGPSRFFTGSEFDSGYYNDFADTPMGSISALDEIWVWVYEEDNGDFDELLEMETSWIELKTRFRSAGFYNNVKVDTAPTVCFPISCIPAEEGYARLCLDNENNCNDARINSYSWDIRWNRRTYPDWN